MKEHYYWWDLEASKFKGILYDSIGTYFLFEHSYTNWDEFVEADPHMAYEYLTYIRFNALEQQFVDLRVIPQMLGVKQVPIQSVVQDINRYEWLKSIIDLTLFRFSSLRDISFHFVNEVLELQISDHSLNVKQISKALRRSNSQLIKNLKVLEKLVCRYATNVISEHIKAFVTCIPMMTRYLRVWLGPSCITLNLINTI